MIAHTCMDMLDKWLLNRGSKFCIYHSSFLELTKIDDKVIKKPWYLQKLECSNFPGKRYVTKLGDQRDCSTNKLHIMHLMQICHRIYRVLSTQQCQCTLYTARTHTQFTRTTYWAELHGITEYFRTISAKAF